MRKSTLFLIIFSFSIFSTVVLADYLVVDLPKYEESLNKKYPKPKLTQGTVGLVFTDWFKDYSCTTKTKHLTRYLIGNRTYDTFVDCNKRAHTRHYDQLKKISDERAIKFCRDSYSSYAYYRGRGKIKDEHYASASYVCGKKLPNTSSSESEFQNISDRDICKIGTSSKGEWKPYDDHYYNYRFKYRKEAENRNLSLSDCNKLTKRGNVQTTYAYMSTKNICIEVTTHAGKWNELKRKKYKDEIKKRNITLYQCRNLTGRGQPSESESNNSSNQYYSNLTPLKLCQKATTTGGNWEKSNGNYAEYVEKAKQLSYSLEYCNNLTGRGVPYETADATPPPPNRNYILILSSIFVAIVTITTVIIVRIRRKKGTKTVPVTSSVNLSDDFNIISSKKEKKSISTDLAKKDIKSDKKTESQKLINKDKILIKEEVKEEVKEETITDLPVENVTKTNTEPNDDSLKKANSNKKDKSILKIEDISDNKKTTLDKEKIAEKPEKNIIRIIDVTDIRTKVCKFCETENLGDEKVCQICGEELE